MSKTLSDLVTGVRMYLDEARPEDFTEAEVLSAINYGYHTVVSKVMEIYEEFYLTVTPLQYSTVANQQEYTISETILKIERVEINYDPSEANSEPQRAMALKLDEIPLALQNSLLGGSALFNAGYYFIGAQSSQKIGFIPMPQNTATNNISIWGIVAPNDLEEDDDPVLIPYVDNFAQIIEKLAASRLLKKGQQAIGPAADLLNEANLDILNYQTFIKERQSDGPQMIVQSSWDDINVGDGNGGL